MTFCVVGAGDRGSIYARFAREHPDLARCVGVAEPRSYFRNRMARKYSIPPANVFADWKEAAERERFADAVLITTQDQMHAEPAVAFARKGYHILLEKPMAVTMNECRQIVDEVSRCGVLLAVGHVLRYTPYNKKIKEIIQSGVLGQVINIQHLEPVGFQHHAHSYVRGNWNREDKATFMLLAKSVHDIDLIRWWMDIQFQSVSSFGSLSHFRPENAPKNSGTRCMDCAVESECVYSAKKIYLDSAVQGKVGWPVSIITEEPTIESVTQALLNGPYGRCVYKSDNNV